MWAVLESADDPALWPGVAGGDKRAGVLYVYGAALAAARRLAQRQLVTLSHNSEGWRVAITELGRTAIVNGGRTLQRDCFTRKLPYGRAGVQELILNGKYAL
jgi:hypothetical protein